MDAASCHHQKVRQLENSYVLLVLAEIQRWENFSAILLDLPQLKMGVSKPLPPIPNFNSNPNKKSYKLLLEFKSLSEI